jgi:hypothetical protein
VTKRPEALLSVANPATAIDPERHPVVPDITGKIVTCTRSTKPAAIKARLSDRLPCERSGTSHSSLSLATTSTASPRTTVTSGQSSGPSSVLRDHRRGMVRIRSTHGSGSPAPSVFGPSISRLTLSKLGGRQR